MFGSFPVLAIMSLPVLLAGQTSIEARESQSVAAEQQDVRCDLSADETLVFYPTCGSLDEADQTWSLPIHGIIYEPEEDSLTRAALLAAIRKGLQLDAEASESQVFNRRLGLFLVDNERGQRLSVRVGSRVFEVGESGANGHFRKTLRLPVEEVNQLAENGPGGRWLSFEAVTRASDKRRFTGRVCLVEPVGLSVISDIDDTIKLSQVRDRKELLANTFLRPFKAAPGMVELYRKWAGSGVAFHYVSGSPWQLYPPLAEFLKAAGFPQGSFHLKHFRLKDRSIVSIFSSQEAYKLAAIEPILTAYPKRRFLLVGDSGEQDPEIYTRLATQHPKQIAAVFIRNVTEESADNARFEALRKGLGAERFRLFEDAGSLVDVVEAIRRGR